MRSKFLEAGQIVNTHGIHGEIKILPWADSPDFLICLDQLYIEGAPVKLLSARVHKGCVVAALDGVNSVDDAAKLKNKIVHIDRDVVQLEEGRHFIADLVGLRAINAETGEELGTVCDILSIPANDVYVIRRPGSPGEGDAGGAAAPKHSGSQAPQETLVPAVPEFIVETNIDEGYVKLRLIEGM